jgi:hypothetical protein
MPIIPAYRRLRQEDHKLEASLGFEERPEFQANVGYIIRCSLKKIPYAADIILVSNESLNF